MKIITFSGVDGSGKSSQLELFRKELENKGVKAAYFHAVHFSAPQAAKRLFARSSSKPGEAKAITKSSSLGVLLRKTVLLLDLYRFHRYLKRLERSGVTYLISDRYFYDSLVNIAYLDGTTLSTPYANFSARFIPKPDKAFFLSVSPEAVMGRDRAPEQGLQYLKDKQGLFQEAATLWGFITIDGNAPLESVHMTLSKHL